MEFVAKCLIYKKIKIPSTITSEITYPELTIENKSCIVSNVYRPLKESNLSLFFQDLTFLRKKYLITYDNIIMDDFNTDVKANKTRKNYQKMEIWSRYSLHHEESTKQNPHSYQVGNA